MIQEKDYEFKIIVVGNAGVGKSQLLSRLTNDQFSDSYRTTVGADCVFKSLTVDGKNVKFQIWDTAGQERFRAQSSAYYKGADAIVFVYDVSNQGSFEDVDKLWINEIEYYCRKDIELLLIGNKSDLDSRTVPTEKGNQFAQSKTMGFVETSAKTSDQVDAAFITLARILIKKIDEQERE